MTYEEWLEICLDYDWWDCVYDGFKEDCAGKGVRVDEIYFSSNYGWSAAFNGRVEIEQVMRHLKLDEQWPALYRGVRDDGSYATVRSSRNCNPEVNVEEYTNQTAPSGIFEGLDQQAWEELMEEQWSMSRMEDIVECYVKDLCRELAKSLEAEYDYLTSEESYNEWKEMV